MDLMVPDKSIIEEAHKRIFPFVHRTPVFTSRQLDEMVGVGTSLHFKCENLQKVGAFKFRGACNAVFSLSMEELEKGVVTHSSGNHAQALALAAKMKGIPAFIIMPENASIVKVNAVKGYGAEIIFCTPTLEAREYTTEEVIKKTGATFIHPYNNYGIIAGQATAAKELIEDVDNLEVIITPVGGGGLLAGSALSAKYFGKEIEVMAGEPSGADDAYKSLKAGVIIPSLHPDTIADGLLTSLGVKNFPIIQEAVKTIICVSDDEIIAAMKLLWERLKIVVEPSGAVPFAAVLKQKEEFKNKSIGVILSGGNVDLSQLPF